MTEGPEGEMVVRYTAEDESDEARWAVGEMQRLHDGAEIRWGDVAIFYRTNAQSRVIEEQLMHSGIPYKVIGGTRCLTTGVRSGTLWRTCGRAINPADEVSLKRVVNLPKRGVGDSSIAKMDEYARAHGLPFAEVLRDAPEAGVTGRAVRGLAEFEELLVNLRAHIAAGPAPLLERILTDSGYVVELEADGGIEAEGRLENLSELIGTACEFESVEEFLERTSLVADADSIDDDEVLGAAHDVARGQGPRVPRRLPDRHGRGCLPAPASAERPEPDGGGASPRVPSASLRARARTQHPRHYVRDPSG